RQDRTHREQLDLELLDHRVELLLQACRPRHSQGGVQLIELAVGLDTRMVLRDPAPAEEARLPGVTGLRVDARHSCLSCGWHRESLRAAVASEHPLHLREPQGPDGDPAEPWALGTEGGLLRLPTQ